jgi:SAM-dependent methyltransferase
MSVDYAPITELPGVLADREQIERIYQRYALAADAARGVDVLEVGCGGGMGLGYVGKRARRVVGGDRTFGNLYAARRHYGASPGVAQLDAEALPFASSTFDLVLLFEVLYYLGDPVRFLNECKRILRRPGKLLISTVNKDWQDFNPSAYSVRYYSAEDLRVLLVQEGFAVDLRTGFPDEQSSQFGPLLSVARRAAVRFHLIPKSFKYKALLKRLVYGSLRPLPPELDADEPSAMIQPLNSQSGEAYKILYATASLV